jgi:hypothetical protein
MTKENYNTVLSFLSTFEEDKEHLDETKIFPVFLKLALEGIKNDLNECNMEAWLNCEMMRKAMDSEQLAVHIFKDHKEELKTYQKMLAHNNKCITN